MKILAPYDISGNVDALEAVLVDPRAADPDVVLAGVMPFQARTRPLPPSAWACPRAGGSR